MGRLSKGLLGRLSEGLLCWLSEGLLLEGRLKWLLLGLGSLLELEGGIRLLRDEGGGRLGEGRLGREELGV